MMRLDHKQINPVIRFSDQVNSKANDDCTLFRCSVCKEQKPREQFFKNKSKAQGITAACKPCHQDIRRRLIKEGKMIDKKPHGHYKAYTQNWTLEKKYGITVEQFDEMRVKQEYRCWICHKHESELGKILHIDHNHATGKVRALLCMHCNHAIGSFKENVNSLENAINYLVEYNG